MTKFFDLEIYFGKIAASSISKTAIKEFTAVFSVYLNVQYEINVKVTFSANVSTFYWFFFVKD